MAGHTGLADLSAHLVGQFIRLMKQPDHSTEQPVERPYTHSAALKLGASTSISSTKLPNNR